MWKITIYRTDSHTPVVLENVKYAWWEDDRYVVSVLVTPGQPQHFYVTYRGQVVSHVKEEPLTLSAQ